MFLKNNQESENHIKVLDFVERTNLFKLNMLIVDLIMNDNKSIDVTKNKKLFIRHLYFLSCF